ncbi:MAG TPA: hypothetical protein VED40_23310 [Azospirillaceae bacterium]|nr:hypothetical protein [Azospirillaceae bacterium]
MNALTEFLLELGDGDTVVARGRTRAEAVLNYYAELDLVCRPDYEPGQVERFFVDVLDVPPGTGKRRVLVTEDERGRRAWEIPDPATTNDNAP